MLFNILNLMKNFININRRGLGKDDIYVKFLVKMEILKKEKNKSLTDLYLNQKAVYCKQAINQLS